MQLLLGIRTINCRWGATQQETDKVYETVEAGSLKQFMSIAVLAAAAR